MCHYQTSILKLSWLFIRMHNYLCDFCKINAHKIIISQRWEHIYRIIYDPFLLIYRLKHSHQRCNATSLDLTFFNTNICRLEIAGQKKYLSHNVFLTSFSQRITHNVVFTSLSLHIRPQPHDIRIIFLYVLWSGRRTNTPKISQIRLPTSVISIICCRSN